MNTSFAFRRRNISQDPSAPLNYCPWPVQGTTSVNRRAAPATLAATGPGLLALGKLRTTGRRPKTSWNFFFQIIHSSPWPLSRKLVFRFSYFSRLILFLVCFRGSSVARAAGSFAFLAPLRVVVELPPDGRPLRLHPSATVADLLAAIAARQASV